MIDKLIIPVPKSFKEHQEEVSKFIEAILTNQNLYYRGSDKVILDKINNFFLYQLNVLNVSLSKDDIDLLINNSLGLIINLIRLTKTILPNLKTNMSYKELEKLDNIRYIIDVTKEITNDLIGSNYSNFEVNSDDVTTFIDSLNNINEKIDYFEATNSILIFVDRDIVLNMGILSNPLYLSNKIDLIEQKEIAINTIKIFLETIDSISKDIGYNNNRDNSLLKYLVLIYLHLV